jgi:hypothetical protein
LPFLRFSRDKRGYEHFYLVHQTTRRGKSRTRVLYFYRTPPDVRVGREPFDPHMRREIEAKYPDIVFDWKAIVETPIPSAETEKWRERRRAEKALRQAQREDAAADAADAEPVEAGQEAAPADPGEAREASESNAPALASADDRGDAAPGSAPVTDGQATPSAGSSSPDAARRKRRRRRGRRGGGSTPDPVGH